MLPPEADLRQPNLLIPETCLVEQEFFKDMKRVIAEFRNTQCIPAVNPPEINRRKVTLNGEL